MCFPPQESGSKQEVVYHMVYKHREHIPNPVYLGVTLDRTLNYKEHKHKLNAKHPLGTISVGSYQIQNWEPNQEVLALCYSTAEYASPVWERSTRVSKLDPALNKAGRSITGCLRPTSVENVYILAGIAPPVV